MFSGSIGHSPLALVDLQLAQVAFVAVRAVARELADAIDTRSVHARTIPTVVNVSLTVRSDDAVNALTFVSSQTMNDVDE